MILRFRKNEVAVLGDISEMYHRVLNAEKNQHIHRFLWRNMDTTREVSYMIALETYRCGRIDNGTQMVGAEKELRKMIEGWDVDKLRDYGADKGIEWKFTTQGAPHQNDCAEALVKSCKYALKKAFEEHVFTSFELYKLLAGCWQSGQSTHNRTSAKMIKMAHNCARMTCY